MAEAQTLNSTISYICDLCSYKSKCNIEIENHNCSPVQNQEDVGQLKFLLYLEKFKNKMYTNITKKNPSIEGFFI